MILHGDAAEMLKTLNADSVDACVTDPPYELTSGKKGGSGEAFLNLNSPAGRARVTTGGGFMGKEWDATGVPHDPAFWREVLRVLKPGAHLLAFGGTRTYHRMTCAIEAAGFEVRDCIAWIFATGFPKSLNIGDGLGTALKPAFEPIVLARKPFKGTVKGNVEQFGTGALNIDACRIGTEVITSIGHGFGDSFTRAAGPDATGSHKWNGNEDSTHIGRWPSNVALDELAAMVLDEQSGEMTDGVAVQRNGGGQRIGSERTYGGYDGGLVRDDVTYGGSGGASRFFFCAKPSREERDLGCYHLTHKTAGEVTDRKDGSAGLNNPRAGAGRTGGGHNHHPTVKPVELMRWLVRLVTPVNGTVLDPFTGSGTTGMACVYEQREFIGIEREADYIEIARARIAAVAPLFSGTPLPGEPQDRELKKVEQEQGTLEW